MLTLFFVVVKRLREPLAERRPIEIWYVCSLNKNNSLPNKNLQLVLQRMDVCTVVFETLQVGERSCILIWSQMKFLFCPTKLFTISNENYLQLQKIRIVCSFYNCDYWFSKLNFITPCYKLKTEAGNTFLVTSIVSRSALKHKLLKDQEVVPHFYFIFLIFFLYSY